MSSRFFTTKEVKKSESVTSSVPSWSLQYPSLSQLYTNIKYIMHGICISVCICECIRLPITLLCYIRAITGDLYTELKTVRFKLLLDSVNSSSTSFEGLLPVTKSLLIRASALNNLFVLFCTSCMLAYTIREYKRELNRTKNL